MKYLKREVIKSMEFKGSGDFQGMYAAQKWLEENGYDYGSTCVPDAEVAITKGEYDFPQKWKNFSSWQKKLVDGVMVSSDYRNGTVNIYLFN